MNDLLFFTVGLGALIFLGAGLNRLRQNFREPKTLEPNCLLTKSPVVVVSGPRPLLDINPGWEELPVHLLAHGYDVRILRLPRQDVERRRDLLDQVLRSQTVHLVMDEGTAGEMTQLLSLTPPLSLTIPRGDGIEERKKQLLQKIRTEAENEWRQVFAEDRVSP